MERRNGSRRWGTACLIVFALTVAGCGTEQRQSGGVGPDESTPSSFSETDSQSSLSETDPHADHQDDAEPQEPVLSSQDDDEPAEQHEEDRVSSGPEWWTISECPADAIIEEATGVNLPLATGRVTASTIHCFYAASPSVASGEPYVELLTRDENLESHLGGPSTSPTENGCRTQAPSPLGVELHLSVGRGGSKDPCSAANEIFAQLTSEGGVGPFVADYDNASNEACDLLRAAELEAWTGMTLTRDDSLGSSAYQRRIGTSSFCEFDFRIPEGSPPRDGFVMVSIASLEEASRDAHGNITGLTTWASGPPWTFDESGFTFEEGATEKQIAGRDCQLSGGRQYCAVDNGYVIVVLSTPATISASGITAQTNEELLEEFARRVLVAYES